MADFNRPTRPNRTVSSQPSQSQNNQYSQYGQYGQYGQQGQQGQPSRPTGRPAASRPVKRKQPQKKSNPLASLLSKKSAPKTRISSTTKNGIKMYEDKTDYSKMNDDSATYYNGEVYFAAKKPMPMNTAVAQKRRRQPRNGFEAFFMNLSRAIQEGGKKGAAIYLAILLAISVLLSVWAMSFLNDILAYNRDKDVQTITVGENATTSQIIGQLDKAGLIKHGTLCKIFMGLTSGLHNSGDKGPVYLSGVYYLSADMGLEKMLLSCREVQKAETVTVTIPEGFTIDQIAQKLEKAGVCMSDEFYNNLEKANFNSFKFIAEMDEKKARYHYLEGYLYPDTYEFFVGQNASSVINKLLENSKEKWTKEYAAKAKEMGYTMDEVLTLASIVQKEAGSAEQMPVISKIFMNRLGSSEFPSLQSDATNYYVTQYIYETATASEKETYWARYSTYACKGLPVGPICNPGKDAIESVLYPGNTDAFYFCHDKSGNIYTARTEAEHNANYMKVLSSK